MLKWGRLWIDVILLGRSSRIGSEVNSETSHKIVHQAPNITITSILLRELYRYTRLSMEPFGVLNHEKITLVNEKPGVRFFLECPTCSRWLRSAETASFWINTQPRSHSENVSHTWCSWNLKYIQWNWYIKMRFDAEIPQPVSSTSHILSHLFVQAALSNQIILQICVLSEQLSVDSC